MGRLLFGWPHGALVIVSDAEGFTLSTCDSRIGLGRTVRNVVAPGQHCARRGQQYVRLCHGREEDKAQGWLDLHHPALATGDGGSKSAEGPALAPMIAPAMAIATLSSPTILGAQTLKKRWSNVNLEGEENVKQERYFEYTVFLGRVDVREAKCNRKDVFAKRSALVSIGITHIQVIGSVWQCVSSYTPVASLAIAVSKQPCKQVHRRRSVGHDT